VPAKAIDLEPQVRKFRKQGWSEAKIKRWLEQKEQTKERHIREDEALAKGGAHELDRWIMLLKELIKVRQIPMIGFLLHWYHSSVEGERIKNQAFRSHCGTPNEDRRRCVVRNCFLMSCHRSA
jgi:hypothetical protein